AVRRALKIDPKNGTAHADLGLWLEYDAEGGHYVSPATATQAINEYHAVDKGDLAQNSMEGNDPYVMLKLRRLAEREEGASGPVTSVGLGKLRLAAVAMRSGVPAALAEADAMPSEIRWESLRNAAEALLWCRYYKQAAGLFDRATHDPNAPAWVAARNDLA